MKTVFVRIIAVLAVLAGLTGCVAYEPYPYATPAAAFDRSWNAALGALHDQGVQVAAQDRSAGLIEGRQGTLTVRARVLTQADGRVRVEFNTSGSGPESHALSERISRSYDAYMGR